MHHYQYLHDPSWVIESDAPRDDLLEWAWWSEIPAPAEPKPEPEPVDDEPAQEAELEKPAAKAPRKPRTPKAAE